MRRAAHQYGELRTEADTDGNPQLIFYGYVNCPKICSAALLIMAQVVDGLSEEGVKLAPTVITINPSLDTVHKMKEPLARMHPDFIGLTGN
ncbi:MAG: SCO family protein [Roseobacter sp.]